MALPELLANSPTPGAAVALTTLASAQGSTNSLTFTMNAAAPAALQSSTSGQFRAVIDSEIILFDATQCSTTTWTALTRGAEGSTKATHSSGAAVFHYMTAGGLAAAYAALASANTFTGEQVAPDFNVSGLTGATAASRYVGATTSGAPATGTFAKGDFVIDQTGIIWICTTAGSPGTWTAVQPNVELGYASITSAFTTTSSSLVDVTGLSVTVTVGARPIEIDFGCQYVKQSATGMISAVTIMEGSTQLQGENLYGNLVNGEMNGSMRVRLNPSAGSHTYKVQAATSFGSGTTTIQASSTGPAELHVKQL